MRNIIQKIKRWLNPASIPWWDIDDDPTNLITRQILAEILVRIGYRKDVETTIHIEHGTGSTCLFDDEWHDQNFRFKATLETGSAK